MTELYKALASLQAAIGAIPKNVRKEGLKYTYTDLDTIWDAIRKPLKDAGLVVIQLPVSDGDKIGLRSILAHVSGESVESVMFAPEVKANNVMTAIQAAGSSLTYMRRYMLSSMLGLTTDEDTDGAWIVENKREDEGARTEALRRQLEQATASAVSRASVFVSKEEFGKLKAELLGVWGFDAKDANGRTYRALPTAMSEALAAEYAAFEARTNKQEKGEA